MKDTNRNKRLNSGKKLGKKKHAEVNVSVDTIDTVYNFKIEPESTGRHLFDQVFSQDIGKKRPVELKLRAKFFPEDVSELTDPTSQKIFYLQIKESILSGETYCPADEAVLLASYATQVKYGDYIQGTHVPGFLENERVLPQKILEQHDFSFQDWKNKIVSFHKDHKCMTSQEAMVGYLKVAQNLEMFGIIYFNIKNRKGTELKLGIDALGLHVYESHNKLLPKLSFPWDEIKSVAFRNKKFVIRPSDDTSPNFTFLSCHARINKKVLALCMGNHELFVRRRHSNALTKNVTQTDVEYPISQAKHINDDGSSGERPTSDISGENGLTESKHKKTDIVSRKSHDQGESSSDNQQAMSTSPVNVTDREYSMDLSKRERHNTLPDAEEASMLFQEDSLSVTSSPPASPMKETCFSNLPLLSTSLPPESPKLAEDSSIVPTPHSKSVELALEESTLTPPPEFASPTDIISNVPPLPSSPPPLAKTLETRALDVLPSSPPHTGILVEDTPPQVPSPASSAPDLAAAPTIEHTTPHKPPLPSTPPDIAENSSLEQVTKHSPPLPSSPPPKTNPRMGYESSLLLSDQFSLPPPAKEPLTIDIVHADMGMSNAVITSKHQEAGGQAESIGKISGKKLRCISPVIEEDMPPPELHIPDRKKSFSLDLHRQLTSDETALEKNDFEREIHHDYDYDKLKKLFEELISEEKTQSQEDRQHRKMVQEGMDKYKTLRNIQRGLTKTRVSIFEAL